MDLQLMKKVDLMKIKAKEFALTKLYREYYYDQIMKNPEDFLKHDFEKEKIAEYVVKRTGKRWRYFMVTLNFKPDVCLALVMKKMMKCLKKKWIINALWCYEWRDIDKGLHVHMKIEPDENKKIYDCRREIRSTFKHLVGDHRDHVHMRYSNRDDCFDDYIKGFREGERKETFNVDRVMRDKYKLEEFYSYLRNP